VKTPAEYRSAIQQIADLYGMKSQSARAMAFGAPTPGIKADLNNLADRYETYHERAQNMRRPPDREATQDPVTGAEIKP
jgi:hypothetical protein